MGKAGAVSPKGLGNVRKYALSVSGAGCTVTPPDLVTQGILFVVVYGLRNLYLSLYACRTQTRKNNCVPTGIMDGRYDDPDPCRVRRA